MKKIKLAVLTLLGFSTACSTVKNTTTNQTQLPTEETTPAGVAPKADTAGAATIQRIKLMYGVPSPQATTESRTDAERSETAEKNNQ